jgi:cellulose synthase/poly-beta-1,6-N-acetylglucosamine synthase-like glycosyltransferase
LELLFWLSAISIIYIYIGYPVLLSFLAKITKQKTISGEGPLPEVSFIIAAHNEEAVIQQKIENCLNLEYPREKVEIIVVSDYSTDQTEEIVSDFACQGVRLISTASRLGKTGAQNEAAGKARGEILVFSDANSLWEKEALKKLVHPFRDENVGYTCGQLRYINTTEGNSSYSEGIYWRYEIFLRRLETATGSITAGIGAIYAVRAGDYHHFGNAQSHDFEYPHYVNSKGKKAVYINDAVASEKAGAKTSDEYKRKVRMLARVWGSILKSPGIFSPFHTNLLFSWKMVSHRLLRYLAPLPQVLIFAANIALYPTALTYQILLVVQITFYSLALLSAVFQFRPKLFYLPYYFCMFNFASMAGLAKTILGRTPAFWEKAGSTRP